MMFWKMIYYQQDNIEVTSIKCHQDIVENVIQGGLYKRWAREYEDYCTDKCNNTGIEAGMIKCKGCKNWYHPECLAEEKGGIKEDYDKENIGKKWCCNIDKLCYLRRNNEWVEEYYMEEYL